MSEYRKCSMRSNFFLFFHFAAFFVRLDVFEISYFLSREMKFRVYFIENEDVLYGFVDLSTRNAFSSLIKKFVDL